MNKFDKEMGIKGTIGMCVIFVVLFLMAFIFIPPVPAGAENVDIISICNYETWSVELNKEKLFEVQFEHNGNILAMYWYDEPNGSMWAKIWNDIEVVDAGCILPRRLNQPVLLKQ